MTIDAQIEAVKSLLNLYSRLPASNVSTVQRKRIGLVRATKEVLKAFERRKRMDAEMEWK